MAAEDLKLGDIDPNLTEDAERVMLQLMLCWARFDASLTQFLLVAFGCFLDEGSILVGQMDTRMKLDKLKALYSHFGMKAAQENIRNLIQLHKHFVDLRNAVAHHSCLGMYSKAPNVVMFSAGRVSPGNAGLIGAKGHRLEQMMLAADFAMRASNALMNAAAKPPRRRSIQPPAPPSFRIQSHPNPQKIAKGKRGKQPQAPPR